MVTTSDDDSSPMIPADLVLLCSSSTGVCVSVCLSVCLSVCVCVCVFVCVCVTREGQEAAAHLLSSCSDTDALSHRRHGLSGDDES